MNREIIQKISEKIYSLFVINTSAAGIQQKDGRYITKYIPITPSLIENMILSKGSMGCYQQGYRTGYIKWICLDFDCKNKVNPDVFKLYKDTVQPVTMFLDKFGINYLTEFSGRRGLHIWIIFDCIIKKSVGYRILQEIIKNVPINISEPNNEWSLDLFPATESCRNNIVGKQVKFPLSKHRMGGMSYFFSSQFNLRNDFYTDIFFEDQYNYLREYCENNIVTVMEMFNLHALYEREYKHKYKKYRILDKVSVNVDEIWKILTETRVFLQLYNRMKRGQALQKDWTVLLGTLSPCDIDGELVRAVFREFPNYDEEKTIENIKKYKERYFPATFGYLYYLYDLEIEDNLDSEMTGFVYLASKAGISDEILLEYTTLNEKKTITSVQDTIRKEKNYLFYNDESPDIYIWNQLGLMKNYDRDFLRKEIESAREKGCYNGFPEEFRIFVRKESDSKTRNLISLSARDRVLTTQLALELCQGNKHLWKSYSYRPSLTSRSDIFFAWYQSWGDYINRVRAFLEVPFFASYKVMMIDLKGFYDHIDFLTVFEALKDEASATVINILRYLIGYNDSLMSKINNGMRKGVPQGPAYARIIAEIFLDKIMADIESRYGSEITILRYVDDIIIVGIPRFDIEVFFSIMQDTLLEYGLPINTEKSKCFGLIGNLTEDEKALLLHTDNFNYELRIDQPNGILLSQERKENLNLYLQAHEFDMRSIGYIFGNKTLHEAKSWYFKNYRKIIISSDIGRGSNFRRFYQYILHHNDYLEIVLDEGLLKSIPYGTVNFSNFIDSLYLSVQEKSIDHNSFGRIQEEYLSIIDRTKLADNDAVVLDALLMLCLEDALDDQ